MKLILVVCSLLLLGTACKKNTAAPSLFGNWRMVAYTDFRTAKVIPVPTDSLVELSFQFSHYKIVVNNNLESSGEYHINPPADYSSYYSLYFGQSRASSIDFHKDTMILTTLGVTFGTPNEYQYVRSGL